MRIMREAVLPLMPFHAVKVDKPLEGEPPALGLCLGSTPQRFLSAPLAFLVPVAPLPAELFFSGWYHPGLRVLG